MSVERTTQLWPEVVERVHRDGPAAPAIGVNGPDGTPANPFDLLWTRKAIAGSPLAEHVAAAGTRPEYGTSLYDPVAAWRVLQQYPGAFGTEFEQRNRACAEMTEHACALLGDISAARSGLGDSRRIWQAPVEIGDDSAGAILASARSGANGGRTTKSHPGLCTSPAWAEVMEEFGLAGIASLPTVGLGAWLMSLLTNDFPGGDDWRQDYVIFLAYAFYFEYNLDSASFGQQRAERVLQDLNHMWDVPGLPVDLVVRRLHMLTSMAFFDTKRKDEAAVRDNPTDGLTAWVHRDRDWWRDFKALDSGGWAHYLSFHPGVAGRDDMMLCGLTNDWVDLGPDLRNGECNQSVLAMTRGSVTTSALLECYERSVWMLNSQLTPDGRVRPERFTGCMTTIGTCMWEMSNHRHDIWRYYVIGIDSCAEATERDLYRSGLLADCYAEDFTPRLPVGTESLAVSRRPLPYEVLVGGEWHRGEVALSVPLCDAVEAGVLAMSVVLYSYVVPKLLRDGEITVPAFLSYVDSEYCGNFAEVMRSAYASGFDDPYCQAVASLVLEQWWSGMYFAIGLGSLIEAQPGAIAGDRAYDTAAEPAHPTPSYR
ncbi:hypothetical protein F4553_007041 [Allocatelliglobosispora scoriae]|uniref:Uncharacterized protein n=1 Tax=Allocatelliglobosispora scoriae TaxID=643052 RepID=A0A841BWV5_9ACTN|nr:hypothetical protein [Allocatelliglobosispora scoriae]MBB5873607.1 hypothetical protein [Allocatelliglobosispora scoriae]